MGRKKTTLVGKWVQQGRNIGLVMDVLEKNIIIVRWLHDRIFDSAPNYRIFSDEVQVLKSEPKLTRREAATFVGFSISWLYELNKKGVFGPPRYPFFVYPSELNDWLKSDHYKR